MYCKNANCSKQDYSIGCYGRRHQYIDKGDGLIMAVLKLIRNTYRNQTAPENVINYCLNPQKMPNNCYGGQGISLLDPYSSIMSIKNIFCHNYGKQLEHFILSFDKEEIPNLSIPKILHLSYAICEFLEGNQVLFALHETNIDEYYDSGEFHPHIHFVMNTTNINTGNKTRIDFCNEYALKRYVGALLSEFGITEKLIMGFY